MPAKTQYQNGLLYEQAAQFAKDLETSQVAQVDQMLAAWTDSYWGIRKEMDAFLAKVAEAKAAGTPMSPAWAYQQQRLKNVLDETKRQIARYAADASQVTEKAQAAAIQAAVKHAEKLGNAALAQSLPGIGAHMATVNPKVLEAGVGFLADGSVLRNHLALTLPGAAAAKVQEALIHGLATGKSQAWMIRRATEALGISHSRATTILRTESLRAYRHATRATYLANQDVLGGWVWNAHLDARTCVACALMDGTEHPLDATLDGHPRCRCAMVPRTRTWEDILGPGGKGIPDTRPPVRSGKEWLNSQPAHIQQAIMGKAKFNAWADGTITLDDMVARTFSPQWGTMRTERSLTAILEGRNGNYFDAPALPPTASKPVPVPGPKHAKELADRYDLAYLDEWLDTPGNSPQALANVKAAIALKRARNKRPAGSSTWAQVLTPDPAEVKKWLDVAIKDADGLVSPKGYGKAKEYLDSPTLTAQQKVDLQEALDQAYTIEKWEPDLDAVTNVKGSLNDPSDGMNEAKIREMLDDPAIPPQSKANVAQALKEWKAEQAAKAYIPVPKPAIDPAKIKWEKVSDAQAQKWIDQVNQGKVTVDDLYVKFQAAKNAGPKANYAKAILTLEGKADSIPTPGKPIAAATPKPVVPPEPGPAWPTNPPTMTVAMRDTGKVLGTHGAKVYESPDGQKWLFKPPKDPRDGFLSTLDEAASRLQARVGLKAPDTYVVTLGGKRGSIQRMFPSSDGFPGGFRPGELNGADVDLVQREHALDWLLSNHDGHLNQFLRLEDGTMVGIDKGQAFRWFGQDRLDWDFHPNSHYGAPEPVYNSLWRAFAKGDPKVELDPPGTGALWDQIRTIQAIPDDELRATFRGYAEQAAARGLLAKRQQFPGLKPSAALENDVEAFLDALVARKNHLEDDFRALYDKAAKERAKAIPGWKPKAAKPSKKPGLQKWVGKGKPSAPKPPERPAAAVAKVFDSWLDAAKGRYSQFSGGKSLEASHDWARFQRVVKDLDEKAAKELLDRQYLRQEDYDEALALIAKAKAKTAALDAGYKKALAAHDKTVKAYKKDVKDWAEANGIKDLAAGMDDDVVRHNTDPAGIAWARKHFSADRYTEAQRNTLRSYTATAYDAWNAHLRETLGKPTKYLPTFKRMDAAMDVQPIPEDVILHRGTTAEAFKIDGRQLDGSDDLTRLAGSIQAEDGYMSTSVGNTAAFAYKPVQLKVRAPKGTPVSCVQMFSKVERERELILGRGQHMYVHNVYKRNGKWIVEVEIVPEGFDATSAIAKPSATPWKK